MTFDELQLIVQSGVISQREMQATQREIQATMQETQQIVRSIAKGVQAMQENRMQRLEDISAGLIRLYGSLDEDRPTVFRALNTIDRKVANILDRLPPDN